MTPCYWSRTWFELTSKTLFRYAALFEYGAVNDAVGAGKFANAPNLNPFAAGLVAPRFGKYLISEN